MCTIRENGKFVRNFDTLQSGVKDNVTIDNRFSIQLENAPQAGILMRRFRDMLQTCT